MERPAKLVIASHNPGKVREIEDLLRPLGIAVVGAAALGHNDHREASAPNSGTSNGKMARRARRRRRW